jgi:hypothetical protein
MSYYIQVIDSSTQEIIGNLVDVSTTGLKIDGLIALPVDKIVNIRLDTTPEIANQPFIEFSAGVRWCKYETMTIGIFDIGLQIIQISPKDAEILARIAEKYGTKESSFHF